MASEQHGPLLRRNVEGLRLEAVHCLKLKAVHCLSLTMQCETAISDVLQFFSHTILFLRSVVMQKPPDLEQSFPLLCLDTRPCSEERSSRVEATKLIPGLKPGRK